MTETPDDPLDAAWALLLTTWDQDARHKAFVHLASSLDRLPDAARHYRTAASDPARGARAQAGLDEVLRVAMVMLTPPPREERTPRGIWLIPLATMVMVIVLTLALAMVLHNRTIASVPVVGCEVLVLACLPWNRLLKRL